jgi:UDP-glucose 4-epimerase
MTNQAGATILVTGAAGYIGRHLCPRLVSTGREVVGFDQPGTAFSNPGRFVCGDIRRYDDLEPLVRESDLVVHLACWPVGACARDPEGGFAVNALGTSNIAQASARLGRPLIYVSTSEVYGPGRALPMSEDHPTEPVSPYGAGKLCGEIMCRMWRRAASLRLIVPRLFSVYGPDLDGRPRSTVETLFLSRALRGDPIVFTANPRTTRDFVYIEDVIDALVLCIDHFDRAEGLSVNIAAGRGTSLEELAGIAATLVGPAATGGTVNQCREAQPERYLADISLAARTLGYNPRVPVEDGLRMVLASLAGT